MQIIDEWKSALKWFSVQSMLLASAIQGAWMYIPDDMKSAIPANYVHILTIALLVAGIGGRLMKQDLPSDK